MASVRAMDEEQLRQSLLRQKLAEEFPEEARRQELLAEAKGIRERFPACTDPDEKRRLMERYTAIDRELEELKRAEYQSEGYTARSRRRKTKGEIERERRYEQIEKGRRRVVERGKAGAGANTFQRIKSELNYLLNNYTPANDHKIETLIDKWRTSGDPSYDPSVKIRLRNARARKSKRDTAL